MSCGPAPAARFRFLALLPGVLGLLCTACWRDVDRAPQEGERGVAPDGRVVTHRNSHQGSSDQLKAGPSPSARASGSRRSPSQVR